MRRVGRIIGRGVLGLALAASALWLFGPYEPVELNASFEARRFGEGVQVYFESTEANVAGITPGTEKRVIWRDGFKEQRTPYSVLYVHGFSATSEEIRPVPDRVAKALGANLVFTRLRGHGRGGDAMAQVSVNDWMMDLAEALAAARQVGEQVVVIATSTGATMATAAALDPALSQDIAAMVFVSPNYGLRTPLEPLLTWPAARYWLPPIAGKEISSEIDSPEHGKYWTTAYPSVAVLPLAALLKRVRGMDVSEVQIPTLFWFSDNDQVVRPDLTAAIAAQWGDAASVHRVVVAAGDDPNSHVIAGDIQSPGQTDRTVEGFLQWLKTQAIE